MTDKLPSRETAGCLLVTHENGDVKIWRNAHYIGKARYVDTHRWRIGDTPLDTPNMGGVGWLSNEFEELDTGVEALVKALGRR